VLLDEIPFLDMCFDLRQQVEDFYTDVVNR